jgi:uncharacterized NAD-dependent epimerase/dehydratase family protein
MIARYVKPSVSVAVVDSGIAAHPEIGAVKRVKDLAHSCQGAVASGHGTAVAGIIRKAAPRATLYDIPILDGTLGANGLALVEAIRWATDHQIDVVNLSLGSTDIALRDQLEVVCRQAVRAGVILVAAEHNEGRDSYPAIFPEVIGVKGGPVKGGYHYRPGNRIECVARAETLRVCWSGPPHTLVSGNSFAAPYITGMVARIRQRYPDAPLERVRQLLQEDALEGTGKIRAKVMDKVANKKTAQPDARRQHGKQQDFGWIKQAALYPFNKEMHALVRGRDLLSFAIKGIADPVGKGLSGKDGGEALGLPTMGVQIQPRLDAALDGADTLILGYVDQLSRIGKKDLLRSSVRTAIEHGCHVFSLLAVPVAIYGDLYRLADSKGLRIVSPSASTRDVEMRSQAEYGPVDVPVLGVFGTSAQQGKFTVQLVLRRRLLRLGYKLAQVGTEHHAALFGMDLAFPMGYASPLTLPQQYYIPYLDHKMRQICRRRRPDLMLVGSQSGTIPYDVHEQSTVSLMSTAFLLGTKPDACILVVNSMDDDAYIRDTIDAIRALAKAPTLVLAMGDKQKQIGAAYGRSFVRPRPLAPEKIAQRLQRLEDRFGRPAVEILSEQGQQRMVGAVLRHFSAPPG